MSTEKKEFGLPKFDFAGDVTVSTEQAQKLLERPSLKAYDYSTLEVIGMEYRNTLDKDPTWGKFNLTLSLPGAKLNADGKAVNKEGKPVPAIYHLLCLPLTSNNLYAGETSPFMIRRATEILSGFGFRCTYGDFKDAIVNAIQQGKIVGAKAEVFLGYEKDHIGYNEETKKYFVATSKGAPHKFDGNEFDSREQAEGKALALEIDTDKAFLRLLKVKQPVVTDDKAKLAEAVAAQTIAPLEDGDY